MIDHFVIGGDIQIEMDPKSIQNFVTCLFSFNYKYTRGWDSVPNTIRWNDLFLLEQEDRHIILGNEYTITQ